MSRARWGGSEARRLRALWRPRLPVPCCRCGRPVVPVDGVRGEGWQVDHYPIPREMGGTETWPAHATCNMAAGGRRGAQLTNAKKRSRKADESIRSGDERIRNIRGV